MELRLVQILRDQCYSEIRINEDETDKSDGMPAAHSFSKPSWVFQFSWGQGTFLRWTGGEGAFSKANVTAVYHVSEQAGLEELESHSARAAAAVPVTGPASHRRRSRWLKNHWGPT
jgi:hypothetical protein